MGTPVKTVEQRLREFVEVTGFCWLWTGALEKGYGYVRHHRKPKTTAHRYVYEYLVGEIQPGLELDHLCRVRNCVNPDHMEQVTKVENVRRGRSFTANNSRKTHCPSGHEYTEANTIKRGKARSCEACRYTRIRKLRQGQALAAGREYKPRSRTHCPKGHEFTIENTRRTTAGRRCRMCESARKKALRLQADQAQLDASFNTTESTKVTTAA